MPERVPVLELREVRKSYGRREAVRGVTLSVAPGEVVVLLGRNGAGKSTLFHLAAGLLAPDAGDVLLFGLSYSRHAAQILRRVGVVFQSRSLDRETTVRANLAFHGRLFGLSGQELERRIVEASALLGLEDALGTRVEALSGGNQRRVEIARALLSRPELLVMDEPSIGLDTESRHALAAHIRSLANELGTAILWSTHIGEEVGYASRALTLEAGQIVEEAIPG